MDETLDSVVTLRRIKKELQERMYLGGDYALVHLTNAIRLTTDVPTMATNSKEILINPNYFDTLTPDERYAVFIHEICHINFQHHNMPWRLDADYDHEYGNIATDIVINETLEQNGLILPAKAQRRAANNKGVTVPDEYRTSTDIYKWFKKEYPQDPVKQEGTNYKGNVVYDKVAKQWGIITSDADGYGILEYEPISEAEAIQKLGYNPKEVKKVKAKSVATEAQQVKSPDYVIWMPKQPTGEVEKGPKILIPSSVKFPPAEKGQQAGDDEQNEDDEQDENDGQSGQSGQKEQKEQKEQSRQSRQSRQSGDDEDEDDEQSGQGGQDEDDEQSGDDWLEDDDKRPTLKDLLDKAKSSNLVKTLRNAEVKDPTPFFTPSKAMGLKQIINRIFKDIGSQFKTDRERTYARLNRRQQLYPEYQPTKGYSEGKKSVPRLIIYVDFSGSMNGSLETILSEIQSNVPTLKDASVRIKAFGDYVTEIGNILDPGIYSPWGIREIRRSTGEYTIIANCIADIENEAKKAEHVLFITDLNGEGGINQTRKLFNAIKVRTTIITDYEGFNCTNPLVKVYEGIKFKERG